MKQFIPHIIVIMASTHLATFGATESNNWYIGGIYGAQELSPLTSPGREFSTLGIIAGYQYSKYISLETRLTKGVSGFESISTFRGTDFRYAVDINYQGSVLIKASYPVTDAFNFYAIAGYAETKIDQANTSPIFGDDLADLVGIEDFDASFSKGGGTYGMGLSYELNDKFNIFVDYQVFQERAALTDDISEDWNSINVGFSYGF